MLKKPKKFPKSVAEKVADTILHLNKNNSVSDSTDEETAATVVDYDDEEYELPQPRPTEFRKRNVKLLSEQSEKYKGKVVSRKDVESEESENEKDYEHSDSSENEETLTDSNIASKKNRNAQHSVDFNAEEQDIEDVDEEKSEEDEENIKDDSEFDSEDGSEDNEVISKVNHEAEVQKGLCVQNQLRIWERLLELRINLQKILSKANHFPPPEELKSLEHNNKYRELTCKQIFLLLQNLLYLKDNLCSQFPEIVKAVKPSLKRLLPYAEPNSGEPPLKQASQCLKDEFEQFRSYRNDVLLKWDDRTKLLLPGAGIKKKTFNEEYDIIKKIDSALINKSFLIEKSQILKNTDPNGSTQENVRNPNLYDDSDFYHQQLRELIEYKANITSNMSEVTKQFLELQKLRQKMKKKVDTKASKGRKLRYIVHNKLINFMAPQDNFTWTMESIDELSNSLFI